MQNETATAKAPKQFTFGVSEKLKKELGELRKDFTRPAAVKDAPPVAMSEKELFEVLYEVATDRRFRYEIKKDEHGNPEGETIDLFEVKWEAIKARDYSESSPRSTAKYEGLIATIRKLGRQMAMAEGDIQKMIDEAISKAKVTETPAAVEG